MIGLTVAEKKVLALTAELVNLMAAEVIGHGPARQQDLEEFVADIHRIQARIGAQAAARAHPELYRLLGEVIGDAAQD